MPEAFRDKDIQIPRCKKAPGLSTWGFLIISGARRRLNWAVKLPVYKGYIGSASVRHT